jgi:hypothetical protein
MTGRYYAPRFDVRIAGITMAADVTSEVLSVRYESSLDTADMFQIVLRNSNNRFTDSGLFNPGQNVEIHMGYADDLQPMMLGELTSIEPRFPDSGAPTIAITGYDKSYKMRHNEPLPRDFKYMNDSMIVAQIAAENFLIPVVDPSPWFHVQTTQTGTDFAFIKDLASKNFFDVYVRWDKLYFQFPLQTEAHVLNWGESLISFSPRLSTAGLAGLQVIRGYNEVLAEAVTSIATSALLSLDDIVERLGPEALQMLATLGRRAIHSQQISSPIDALGFAKALLQNLIDGLYEGDGRCIGKRFGGKYRLRKVTHRIDDGGYTTEFEVTQRSGGALLSQIRKLTDPEVAPPPDRPRKFYGVAIARVTKAPTPSIEPDPAALLGARVKVKFPWLSDDVESTWARVVTPSAGSDHGMYFMPNEDDMVVVAFQDGELSMPIVIGSVWDGPDRRPPVDPPDQQNMIRMIKSQSGHTIKLDDTPTQETITIEHASGTTLVLKPDGSISMDASKFQFTADTDMDFHASNINFIASNALKINAKDIELQTSQDIKLNATSVAVKVIKSMDVS